MDKNRIRGQHVRSSRQVTTKSISTKGRDGKSGGCATNAGELTSGDLRRATAKCENARDRWLIEPQGETIASEKSAEGIVVRCQSATLVRHCKVERRSERIGEAETADEGPNNPERSVGVGIS